MLIFDPWAGDLDINKIIYLGIFQKIGPRICQKTTTKTGEEGRPRTGILKFIGIIGWATRRDNCMISLYCMLIQLVWGYIVGRPHF